MAIEAFKARIIEFALAGGNALAAHGLLSRPTEDVDLSTPQAGGPGRVLEAIQTALTGDGFQVRLLRATRTVPSSSCRSAATVRQPSSTWDGTGVRTRQSRSTSVRFYISTTRSARRPPRCWGGRYRATMSTSPQR